MFAFTENLRPSSGVWWGNNAFDQPSASASQSPGFMLGRGTKSGQSTTAAGSFPSQAFPTCSFPSFGYQNAPPPPPDFGLITNSTTSDGAGAVSGSTSGNPSFGPRAVLVAPFFANSTASPSLGKSTPFPSASQTGAQPGFGVPAIAPRVTTPYKVTNVHEDGKRFGKMHSISAMSACANKSHEELRWEEHQLKNKGAANGDFHPFHINNAGRNPFALSNTSSWFKPTYNPFSSLSTTSAAATVSPSPSMTTPQNPFSTESRPITFSSIAPPIPSSPAVPSFSSPNTTVNLSPLSTTSASPPFALSLPNTFPATNPPFSFSSQATPPSFAAVSAPQQTTFPSFPSPTPEQTNTQSSISSLLCPPNPLRLNQSSSSTAPVKLFPPTQTTCSFEVSNPGQPPLAMTRTTGLHNIQMAELEPVTHPFGTLPPAPQLSFDRTGTRHPIQYGISTLPVANRPARSSSLLITTSRGLSYCRRKLPVRKHNPSNNVPKVPFFGDDVEGIVVPRADAFLIRRENPRDLIIRTLPENRMPYSYEEESSVSNEASLAAEDDRSDPSLAFTQQAEMKALMPKLFGSDYYTEPAIQELASLEKADPGFCSHVEGFVIGRHNYGNVRFLGDTDVRGLDLNMIVQFNPREVIVYAEGSSKPKVGEGLNKPAEVTLVNIKCMDKKTGRRRHTEEQRVKKYEEFLKKKAEDQGAHFVSYDHGKGEWKFRVDHF